MSDAKQESRWEAIARSPLFGFYVWELYWLAANVARLADEVFEETKVGPDDGRDFIGIDADLHGKLYVILGEAAKIRALIENRPRRGNQSQALYAVQTQRTKALRDYWTDWRSRRSSLLVRGTP